MKWYGLLLPILMNTLSCDVFGQSQQIRFLRFGPEAGLSQSNVTAILQDRHGFMWFGTPDGLNKYDGYSFTIYRNDPKDTGSLTDNHIKHLFKDKQGSIWIATTDGGLNKWDEERGTFTHYRHDKGDAGSISDNSITWISQDLDGSLWVGTRLGGLNRMDRKTGRFTRFTYEADNPSSLSDSHVNVILEDSRHQLWIGTENGGLDLFDRKTGRFIRYTHSDKDTGSIASNCVQCLYEDAWHRLWIGTRGGGLDRLDVPGGPFHHFKNNPFNPNSPARNVILSLAGGDRDELWIGTENGGVSILHLKDGHFENYEHDDLDNTTLSNNSIYSIYKDPQNNMWVGTYSGGVNLRAASKFETYRHNSFVNSPGNNNILDFREDGQGKIWIGTDGGGADWFDPKKGTFTHFRHRPGNPRTICGDYIPAIDIDGRNNVWFGSVADGMTIYDPEKKTYRLVKKGAMPGEGISGNNIASMLRDKDKDLWVATWDGGLNCYQDRTGKFIPPNRLAVNSKSIWPRMVICMLEDRKGYLWFGTYEKGVDRLDKQTGTIVHFGQDSTGRGLSSNTIYCLFEDRAGNIWIGTKAGLNRLDGHTGVSRVYSVRDGLPDAHILGILEDGKGNLWLSTNDGLCRFDPKTGEVANFFVADGLQSNEFKAHCCLKSAAGAMYFGGVNGFNRFFPDSVRPDSFEPALVFTNFLVFNKEVAISRDGQETPLKTSISQAREISLPYSQSVISFVFASLNYVYQQRKQYAYKLEGFDKSWNDVGTAHSATYTNLAPGEYTLRVRCLNSQGKWTGKTTDLKLTILPPLWMSWWFRTLAFFVLAGAAAAVTHRRVTKVKRQKKILEDQVQERTERLAESIQLERKARKEAEVARAEAEKATQAKSIFLATMSHEIRTPMNGVIGIADLLIGTPLNEEQRSYTNIIRTSGESLLNVINDILDFSKIESGNLELEEQDFDLHTCIEEVLDICADKAAREGIELLYQIDAGVPDEIVGDRLRLRQILMNLVGNAVKFTHKGEVVIRIQQEAPGDREHTLLRFTVSDTGIGIPPDQADKLFKAFSQVDASMTRKYGGTGLGLAICKKLVEVMGGTIEVSSQPEQGSRFSFTIRTRAAALPAMAGLRKGHAVHAEKQVLIVEGNETGLTILQDQLRHWGLSPFVAASGAAALEILEKNPAIALMIMDSQLPDSSHIRLAHVVSERFPRLAVILLASIGDEDAKSDPALYSGLLTKPIKHRLLYAKVIEALSTRRTLTGTPFEKTTSRPPAVKFAVTHPWRILLAEDDPINQLVATAVLNNFGYEADLANDGVQATILWKEKRHDLILMDMQMPEMDGIEATRAIRQTTGPQPVIIAMTANALQGDRKECLDAGMNDYISKPFDPQELLALLAKWYDPVESNPNG